MGYTVLMTAHAEHDLEAIHEYIAEHDSPKNAKYVLDRLSVVVDKLSTMPERGAVPPELRALGMTDLRQLYFKPYRVIYRIAENRVIIYVIADGRQDMHLLLARRLLGG
ncbi:MAG: type II toxin-antitoxin system RelE/ParE family toxin [Gammaproteobacteria bacterium]|nr:type II toxin-antitoxin system RelE/ParE family toxin [Gammaproteobacteria bacterium]